MLHFCLAPRLRT